MKLVMKMDMNLGVSMVKIFTMDFFMVADNVHSYSYRLFLVIRKDFLRGQFQFLMAGFAQKWKVEKKTRKIDDETIFFECWERSGGWNGRQ